MLLMKVLLLSGRERVLRDSGCVGVRGRNARCRRWRFASSAPAAEPTAHRQGSTRGPRDSPLPNYLVPWAIRERTDDASTPLSCCRPVARPAGPHPTTTRVDAARRAAAP